MPNGSLLVGGSFQNAGAVSVSNIASWDGISWSSFGGGVNGPVTDIEPDPTEGPEDFLVAGTFTLAIPSMGPAFGLALWKGEATHQWLGQVMSLSGGGIGEVVRLSDASIVVAGQFTSIDGVTAYSVARKPFGGPWQAMGGGFPPAEGGYVSSLAVQANGDVIAGGIFEGLAQGSSDIARWNGTAWKGLGVGLDSQSALGQVAAILPFANGRVTVGGTFRHAGYGLSAYYATWVPPGGTDTDHDGADDVCDNCKYVSNAAQTDSGGIGTTLADGMGDACQCGDVTGDGRVLDSDVDAIRDGLTGVTAAVVAADRCSVSGAIDASFTSAGMRRDCNVADLSVLERALLGLTPAPAQACAAALP
jgi:hypothetical protein